MSEQLTLEEIPTGVTGWIAVVQSNMDLIEQFVNDIHENTMVMNDQVVCMDDEIVINFT